MDEIRVYQCEDNADGIFTAIYHAFYDKNGHANNKIEASIGSRYDYNLNLFSHYIEVKTDYLLSAKVATSIRRKISEEALDLCIHAAASDFIDKAETIYRFLILGFAMGKPVLEHLSNDYVNTMHKLRRNVWREVHHYYGFLRFSEQSNGMLISTIKPKNHVLPFLAEHFSDRFMGETFIIYDEIRECAVLHVANQGFTLVEGSNFILPEDYINTEDDFQNLWKTFVKHIAIKERANYKLQRNMLPLRFRDRMTEFK